MIEPNAPRNVPEERKRFKNDRDSNADKLGILFKWSRHAPPAVSGIEYKDQSGLLVRRSRHVFEVQLPEGGVPPMEAVDVVLPPGVPSDAIQEVFWITSGLTDHRRTEFETATSADKFLVDEIFRVRFEIADYAFSGHRLQAARFFTWLDKETAGKPRAVHSRKYNPAKKAWEETPLGPDELENREAVVDYALEALGERTRRRALAYPGRSNAPKLDAGLGSQLEVVAEILIDAMALHYSKSGPFGYEQRIHPTWALSLNGALKPSDLNSCPGFGSTLDIARIAEAFEFFANGQLRPSPDAIETYLKEAKVPEVVQEKGLPPQHFQPDEEYKFFYFAELALCCLEAGYMAPLWRRLLPVFVRCAWVVLARYVETIDEDGTELRIPEPESPLDPKILNNLRYWTNAMDVRDLEHEFGFLLTFIYPDTRRLRGEEDKKMIASAHSRRALYSVPLSGA